MSVSRLLRSCNALELHLSKEGDVSLFEGSSHPDEISSVTIMYDQIRMVIDWLEVALREMDEPQKPPVRLRRTAKVKEVTDSEDPF